ncbi:hypothetical protein GDO86_014143 [Hymenochirus boettgeri]|uniref:Tumor necrosis factor receptor superfamily member 5 n=1 Tax=Hymenochirus boettgeri TaxID=247094 RepID=A0A8T2JTC5_9PIPI|nr:hypothetical protein GDO86_014143 [Hymenochirus boettgeri]
MQAGGGTGRRVCYWLRGCRLLSAAKERGMGLASACHNTQYLKDGKCCSLCSPGKRLSEECTANLDTVCIDCTKGEFQDQWNKETACQQHAYCDPNAGKEQVTEGTTDRNVECQCQAGRHCSSPQCETCILNKVCGPGYGVTRTASSTGDTQCSLCTDETFSNTSSDTEPCKLWQSCDDKQEEIFQGNSTKDRVCKPGYKIEPVEDNDPEADTTMRGDPVAQEEGKDSRMPQEERDPRV